MMSTQPDAEPREPDAEARVTDILRTVLSERFGLAAHDLAPDRALDTLGLDSLGFVEYVFEVEKALNITLPDVPRDIATVGALVALIEAEVRRQRAKEAQA